MSSGSLFGPTILIAPSDRSNIRIDRPAPGDPWPEAMPYPGEQTLDEIDREQDYWLPGFRQYEGGSGILAQPIPASQIQRSDMSMSDPGGGFRFGAWLNGMVSGRLTGTPMYIVTNDQKSAYSSQPGSVFLALTPAQYVAMQPDPPGHWSTIALPNNLKPTYSNLSLYGVRVRPGYVPEPIPEVDYASRWLLIAAVVGAAWWLAKENGYVLRILQHRPASAALPERAVQWAGHYGYVVGGHGTRR